MGNSFLATHLSHVIRFLMDFRRYAVRSCSPPLESIYLGQYTDTLGRW